MNPPRLIADRIAVSFAGLRALSDVSLELVSGAVHGLIGPNGAGKTTLVNILTGFQAPTAGNYRLDGERLNGLPPHKVRRGGIARTFQGGRLFKDLTVLENLEVAGLGLGLDRGAAEVLAEEVLEWIGIADLADELAGSLPYTDERRVGIGRALVGRPAFILMDEPAAGMSVHEAEALGRLILRIAEERHCGVLVIEHNIGLVLDICSHITVLDSGEIIEAGDPETIRRSEAVRHAYMGTQADIVSDAAVL